jgi:hypothetical protein
MSLDRGNVKGFEHDRMVMLFSMMDGDKEIPCAVSSSAMDELERGEGKARSARRPVPAVARPDRAMRVAQIPRAGV